MSRVCWCVQEQIQEVIDAMFLKEVEDGDVIIRQGDDGDYFYVIEDGVYDIYVKNDGEPEKRVGSYMNTGSFGELALMYNMPRAATIKAASHGSLWVMDRQTFRKIVLKSAFKKRKEYEKLLENVPMLKHLKHYERMNLCDALMPMSFEPNQIIIRQGDEAEGMYFVEEGTVRVTMHSETDSNEVEMSRLTKGEYFGARSTKFKLGVTELALVTHRPRAASVYAVDHVKLASLDVQAFERLLGPCMDIMKRNIDDYEKQVAEMFGARIDMDELR
ncbi:PRKAR2B [Cordylochernes scorpioides]|uniref:PRKAR2B n=1 Tax=Cordylochernes scorpioides TaxID=51811 RepID=A0ABY6KZ88_9ARAC|nr:PRKAR2B [Cordylochernes scorpioides]